jgi:hypothetical protein
MVFREVKMSEFIRKYSTQFSTAAFAIVGITGVLMFVGIRNQQVGMLHEWIGVAFVIIAILHVVRNGKAFSTMMKQTRSLIIVGLLGGIGVLTIGASLYASGAGKGNPNRAASMVVQQLAKAPISQVAPVLGLSGDQAVARLRQGGVAVKGADQSLTDVARGSDRSPPQLFLLILADQNKQTGKGS